MIPLPINEESNIPVPSVTRNTTIYSNDSYIIGSLWHCCSKAVLRVDDGSSDCEITRLVILQLDTIVPEEFVKLHGRSLTGVGRFPENERNILKSSLQVILLLIL